LRQIKHRFLAAGRVTDEIDVFDVRLAKQIHNALKIVHAIREDFPDGARQDSFPFPCLIETGPARAGEQVMAPVAEENYGGIAIGEGRKVVVMPESVRSQPVNERYGAPGLPAAVPRSIQQVLAGRRESDVEAALLHRR
jgi:hypothetical protein